MLGHSPVPFTPSRPCTIIMVKTGSFRHWFLGTNGATFLQTQLQSCSCILVSGVSTYSGSYLFLVEKVNSHVADVKIKWHMS